MPRRTGLLGCVAVATALLPASASADVLHDQFDNPGSLSTNASDPPGAGNAAEVADDFTVPAGQIWTVDGIDLSGFNAGITTSIDLAVYADSGGLPGAVIASRPATTPTGTDPNWSVPLNPAAELTSGTYWIGVQVNVNAPSWAWRNRTVQSGFPAVFRAEFIAGSCAADFTFRPKATCLGSSSDPDQVWRLLGTSRPVPAPAPAPAGSCAGRQATITGTAGADVIAGTPGPDVIDAAAGNDNVRGLGGADVICGSTGKDRLAGGPGKDRLLGGSGRDTLKGGKGRDVLKGGPGKDLQKQ
jgi:RTX calcium-binding nonapeptide repeat (4 copies)